MLLVFIYLLMIMIVVLVIFNIINHIKNEKTYTINIILESYDVPNRNNRIYSKRAIKKMITEIKKRDITFIGEVDHPK